MIEGRKGKAEMLQRRKRALWPLIVFLFANAQLMNGADGSGADLGPASPNESLRSFQTRPGFTVDLVVAEPLVMDPVAIDWGPDGKLWVVEMADYPLGLDDKGKPGGRVRCLEDTDADGRYDKSTVFLDGLRFPNGVLVWKKGILVTAAPQILYAEDTNGDGRADHKVALYTGFLEKNQQLRVNGLRYGLDNWVYCASGAPRLSYAEGTRVTVTKTGETIDVGGRDFRIAPDRGLFEPLLGATQFGRNRNAWGDWFGCNNAQPLWHFVLEDKYLRRNPHFVPADPTKQLVVPRNPKIFPIAGPDPIYQNHPGHVTSACGAMIYGDDLLFPPDGPQHAFICEPVNSLVHHWLLRDDGASFSARRHDSEQHREFLASTNRWFRPVMVRTGPDGALWVVDMCRRTVEHPQFMSPRIKGKLQAQYRAGHDRGRIYRVYPSVRPPRPVHWIGAAQTEDLILALQRSNAPLRDLAQRELIQRADRTAIPPLEKLAQYGRSGFARLHALCTLDGFNALPDELVLKALSDPHSGLRRYAIRLAEKRIDENPRIGPALLELVADSNAKVRMQVANSLGQWDDQRAATALTKIAMTAGSDIYLAASVLSSISSKNVDSVLGQLLRAERSPPEALLAQLLAVAVSFDRSDVVARSLELVTRPRAGVFAAWQFTALDELCSALVRRSSSLAGVTQGELGVAGREQLAELFLQARRLASDSNADESMRVRAIRLLGRDVSRRQDDLELLSRLLVPQSPVAIQKTALATISRLGDSEGPQLLLAGWSSHGPEIRNLVLDALLSRPAWSKVLLDQMESGAVSVSEFDATRRQRLIDHRDQPIKQRAVKLLAGSIDANRQKVIEQFHDALTLPGDLERGAEVFKKSCSTCHRLGDIGHDVGPSLASLTDKTPQALLREILDPNRAIEPRYQSYAVVSTGGRVFAGLLAAETSAGITLQGQEGKQQTLLRTEIEALQNTGKSLMPEGIEKEVTPQNLADVMAYIAAAEAPRKIFDGNHPELVTTSRDSKLHLSATNCEIYGTTLAFEAEYGNLGNWVTTDNRAVWNIDVPAAGTYSITLFCACDRRSTRHSYVIQAGNRKHTGEVPDTHRWVTYQHHDVGTIDLNSGRQQIVFRSDSPIEKELIDLKEIILTPNRSRSRR